MTRRLLSLVVALWLAGLWTVAGAPTVAANDAIVVVSDSAQTNWPENVTFTVRARAATSIERIRIEYRYGNQTSAGTASMDFAPGNDVTATFALRTGSSVQSAVPPGVLITYRFIIEDSAGNILRTEPKQFRRLDTRYEWRVLQDGLVTLLTYDTEQSGRALLRAATETIAQLRQRAGIALANPVTIVVYATTRELDSATPPASQSSAGMRAGVQFPGYDLIVMAASGNGADTVRHEMTHAILDDALGFSNNPFMAFPMWLNEGLATYFQASRGAEWDRFLQAAIRANRIMELKDLIAYPGREDEKLLVYAQGVSMVRFLFDRYGDERMAALLRAYPVEGQDDAAFRRAYGKSLLELENEWRQSLNIPGIVQPTPTPVRRDRPAAVATLPPMTVGQAPPATTPVPAPGGESPGPSSTGASRDRTPPQEALDRLRQGFPITIVLSGVVVILFTVLVVAAVIRTRRPL
ncbi:MAG: peptidase MA family metallohydrolase [Dehalococcoidia bacterium]|nr:peptidase MA family metallohydrolase [Dehalococcoidia bacterium]